VLGECAKYPSVRKRAPIHQPIRQALLRRCGCGRVVKFALDIPIDSSIIEIMSEVDLNQTARFADMLAAMGTEPRLRIVRLLLSAHPDGLIAGDIQAELGIPASTLSHHLEKLKHEELVSVRRDGTFLWYSANTDALRELLTFLYAECCTRNKVFKPEEIVQLCK
jgi:DNA-binding transcriptional ArsR family regulator